MGAMFLMELVHFLLPLLVLCCFNPPTADAACTWPEPFAGDVWEDSTHGDLTFGDTDMTGWDFTVLGQTRDSWQCVRVDRYHSHGYMIMVTTSTFRAFQSDWYAYMCLKLTRITDVSYRYYQMTAIQDARGAYERVYIDVTDTITDIDTLCSESSGATGPEYQVLIKSRREGEAKQTCGAPLLATFDYVHTASDGTSTCARSLDTWDVCTDRQVMTFNYTSCSTKVAYSASGAVWCVASVTSSDGGAVYTTVYNHLDATVNNADTYRFSCFAVNTAGTMASVAKQHCRRGQTPEAVPSDNAFPANDVGATLTMPTTYARCPLEEEEKAGSGVNGGAIAGGVVGGLVFVAIAAVAGVLAFRHWTASRKGEPGQTSGADTARTRTGGVTSRSIAGTMHDEPKYDHIPMDPDLMLDPITLTRELSMVPPRDHTPSVKTPLPQQILTPQNSLSPRVAD